MSDLPVVEFDAVQLRNGRGEVYHTIAAEKCPVGVVARRRMVALPNGEHAFTVEHEAAFIRGGGAWLPPLFGAVK